MYGAYISGLDLFTDEANRHFGAACRGSNVTEDLVLRAEQAFEAGDFQLAEDLLRRAGDDPETKLMLGRTLREQGRFAESGEAYAQAMESEEPGLAARARSGWGFALLAQGRIKEAQDFFEQAANLDDGLGEAHRGLGLCRLRAGRLSEAEASIERCMVQAPDDPAALSALAQLRLRQSRSEEAEAALRRVVDAAPAAATAWANLGFIHRQTGRVQEAVEDLQKAADLRPRDAMIRNSLALALQAAGRSEQALEQMRQAVALDESNAGFRDNLSRLLQAAGLLDEAVDQTRRAASLDPSNLYALSRLPVLLMAQGRTQEAVQAADEAAKANPEHPEAQLNLAVALLNAGRPFEAVHAADKAVKLAPNLRDARLCLSQAFLMSGRLDKALGEALAAQALGKDEKSHFLIGMVQKELGLKKEAAENFRACLQYDPEDRQGAGAFLASIEGSPAPDGPSKAYVSNVFNQYAERYDEHMVKELGYRAPQALMEALAPHLPHRRDLRVLDAGCGAGLFGGLLRPLAAELTGVDLSGGMVRMALQTGQYDNLLESDLREYLESGVGPFDLAAAADVFVYMGDLAPVFKAMRHAMAPGGLFAFSVEKSESADYEISPAGRCRHSEAYLRRLAEAAGFEVLELQDAVLRREAGRDVLGAVAVLRAA
ncbi:MAG: hypothetical protein PWQ57_1076 [Desulfovibrionales bacterium]|nr:hypothetical protein [Desulfovibrionales bacterium]